MLPLTLQGGRDLQQSQERQRTMRQENEGSSNRWGLSWLVGGAAVLALLSTLQKLHLGVSLHWSGYLLPLLVGGGGGLVLHRLRLRERRQYAALLQSEAGYQTFYRKTPVMLHSINRDGRIIDASDHWLAVLGYSRDEVIDRPLTDFFCEDSRRIAMEEVLPRFFSTGEVHDIPYCLLRKDGTRIEVLLSAVAQLDTQGAFLRSLAVAVDVTERNAKEREIERLAFFDNLTGLPNRFLFKRQFEQFLDASAANRSRFALVLLDLDRFKGINEDHGHQEGDAVLQAVAERLRHPEVAARAVARLGGDEFALLLELAGQPRELKPAIRALLDQVAAPVGFGPRDLTTTASAGIACYPDDGGDASTLLRHADSALVAAKTTGRNSFSFFSSEMQQLIQRKQRLEAGLRRALENGEFFLCYQPQIDIEGGRIVGVEALLRWRHPEMGVIGPSHFIEVAEESGLIVPIGEWVLRQACTTAVKWQQGRAGRLRLAVNFSPHQFKQSNFVVNIESILTVTGLDPRCFEVELTEGIVMENTEATLMTLADLKVLGVHLAVDDFGTGYSSLSYLKHFPFDRVKIAQEFVRDIPGDSDSAAIVVAILGMAASLGLAVVAEGVENADQLGFLRQHGCREMQGFCFAPPLSPEDFQRLLASETFPSPGRFIDCAPL